MDGSFATAAAAAGQVGSDQQLGTFAEPATTVAGAATEAPSLNYSLELGDRKRPAVDDAERHHAEAVAKAARTSADGAGALHRPRLRTSSSPRRPLQLRDRRLTWRRSVWRWRLRWLRR